jgi:hypothetical protein
MAHVKISCQECPYFEKCSVKTRLFINYCGTTERLFARQIAQAKKECKMLHGYMHHHLLVPSAVPKKHLIPRLSNK